MRLNSIQLSRRHEWIVYAISAAVFGTGAAWAWLHYFAAAPNELGGATPAESWLMKAHGAAAMATLFSLGALLPVHIKNAWRAGRNLRTGVTVLSVYGFLALTGYGLYYAGEERFRARISTAHLWIGFALLPLFLLHILRGKKTRPQSSPGPEK